MNLMRSKLSFIDIALLFFPIAMLLQIPIDPDLMWHLRVGQDLFKGIFPFQDIYSWSMTGYAWVDHEWLTNAIMYKVYGISGLLGLGIAFTAICLGAYLVAVRTGALISRHMQQPAQLSNLASWRLGALLLIVGMYLNQGALGTRPQMISLLGFALVNFWLWQYMLGERRNLWILLVVFWAWANLHGGFVIAVFQVGLALALIAAANWLPGLRMRSTFPFDAINREDYPRKLRHLALVFGGSILASLVNPYTWRVYEEAMRSSLDRYAHSQISEWLAINFQGTEALLLGAFILLFVLWLLWQRRYYSAWHLLLWPVYLYLGMTSIRHLPLLMLFMLPWVYAVVASNARVKWFFDDIVERYFAVRKAKWVYYFYNGALVLMVAVVLVYRVGVWANACLDASQLAKLAGNPDKAVQYLAANTQPDDVMFNGYNWGGYLIWYLPQQKVYIDGRMASWSTADKHILEEYEQIVTLKPGWLDRLSGMHITFVLTAKDSTLSSGLRLAPAYKVVYEDDVALVFRKSP
jgi:hypothetical protein